MTKLQAEIVIALAENQTNISKTASKLFMHRNSLTYHVRKIKKTTGKNPLDFYDMCELLPIAQRTLYGKVNISDQARIALVEIGRKSHGGSDA